MISKKDFNFFSGQETKLAKGKRQIVIGSILASLFLVCAVGLFVYTRMDIENLQQEQATIQARLQDETTKAKLAEVDFLHTRLSGLDEYSSLAKSLLVMIENQKFVSTDNMESLLKALPSSIEVLSLSINNTNWHMECRTNNIQEIAVLLYQLEQSDKFMSSLTSSLVTDEYGLVSFSIDFTLEGGMYDAAQ